MINAQARAGDLGGPFEFVTLQHGTRPGATRSVFTNAGGYLLVEDDLLKYGYDRRLGKHLYTARLGAAYVPPTNYATGRFVHNAGNPAVDFMRLRSRFAGAAGAGWRVKLDECGGRQLGCGRRTDQHGGTGIRRRGQHDA